jgi:hypothetical protein
MNPPNNVHVNIEYVAAMLNDLLQLFGESDRRVSTLVRMLAVEPAYASDALEWKR